MAEGPVLRQAGGDSACNLCVASLICAQHEVPAQTSVVSLTRSGLVGPGMPLSVYKWLSPTLTLLLLL